MLRRQSKLECLSSLIENRVLSTNLDHNLTERLKDRSLLSKVMALTGSGFKRKDESLIRQFLADFFSAEILEIADSAEGIFGMDNPKEVLAAVKLRIDTRRWLMEQLAPAVYGPIKNAAAGKPGSSFFKTKIYLPENARS